VIKCAKELTEELGETVKPVFEVFIIKARYHGSDKNEWALIRKDGSSFPANLTTTAILSEDGEVAGYLCVIEDITERKKSEDTLASIGRILEESLNEVFVFNNKTLRFMQVNRGARENIGYSMDELKNMTPLDIKMQYSKEEFETIIAPVRSGTKEKVVLETVHLRKDGSKYDVEVHLQKAAYQGEDAIVAIILDTTNRKKAEVDRE